MPSLTFPVAIQTMLIERRPNTKIYFPQVTGLDDSSIEEKINKKIYEQVEWLYQEQFRKQDINTLAQMIGTFEIKTNQRNIISMTLSNYGIGLDAANGLTLMTSITFDVQTGKMYKLKDLFKPSTNYVKELSNMVQMQIEQRDIPTVEPFNGITPNQDFYIADKCLVLYFQELEFTPHYIGIPVFPISVFDLENIVNEAGPLGRMMSAV